MGAAGFELDAHGTTPAGAPSAGAAEGRELRQVLSASSPIWPEMHGAHHLDGAAHRVLGSSPAAAPSGAIGD